MPADEKYIAPPAVAASTACAIAPSWNIVSAKVVTSSTMMSEPAIEQVDDALREVGHGDEGGVELQRGARRDVVDQLGHGAALVDQRAGRGVGEDGDSAEGRSPLA